VKFKITYKSGKVYNKSEEDLKDSLNLESITDEALKKIGDIESIEPINFKVEKNVLIDVGSIADATTVLKFVQSLNQKGDWVIYISTNSEHVIAPDHWGSGYSVFNDYSSGRDNQDEMIEDITGNTIIVVPHNVGFRLLGDKDYLKEYTETVSPKKFWVAKDKHRHISGHWVHIYDSKPIRNNPIQTDEDRIWVRDSGTFWNIEAFPHMDLLTDEQKILLENMSWFTPAQSFIIEAPVK